MGTLRHLAIASITLLASVGCGSSDESAPARGNKEFEIPPPVEGQVQLMIDAVPDIQPGADITLCHYIDYRVDADQDITDYEGFQSPGGHHVLLYAVPTEHEVETHPCTETDMLIARYLAGGGSEAGRPDIPDGVALRLKQGAQLMIQTHWINTTAKAIEGRAGFNITMGPASDKNVVADLLTVVSTNIALEPVSEGSTKAECVIGQDMSFFAIGGHEHWRGTHVSITHTPVNGAPALIYDHDWLPHYEADPPRLQYTREDPFVVRNGDRFTADCAYFNESNELVTFPAEMCVMWAFYYPAEKQINCVDGEWVD
jgi:hypothetical protein